MKIRIETSHPHIPSTILILCEGAICTQLRIKLHRPKKNSRSLYANLQTPTRSPWGPYHDQGCTPLKKWPCTYPNICSIYLKESIVCNTATRQASCIQGPISSPLCSDCTCYTTNSSHNVINLILDISIYTIKNPHQHINVNISQSAHMECLLPSIKHELLTFSIKNLTIHAVNSHQVFFTSLSNKATKL